MTPIDIVYTVGIVLTAFFFGRALYLFVCARLKKEEQKQREAAEKILRRLNNE